MKPLLVATLLCAELIVAACGTPPEIHSAARPGSPSASASTSSSQCAIPPLPGLCVGRPATAQEEGAMIAVGQPAFEHDWGVKDGSSCGSTETCFFVGNPSRAMVGQNAGSFYGEEHLNGQGGGTGCWIFLYLDSSGWHYVNGRCTQAPGYLPGPKDRVFVSSCANVREGPSLSAKVLACLTNGTVVDVDSAPVYADSHIWWHLAGKGWMAHDFLVAPKGTA